MEVAARPTHNFAVPSPTSLQFSSQTFKKRTHGDYLRSEENGEINGSWTLRVEVVLEPDCCNGSYLNGAAAAEYGEDVIVKHLRVLGDMHVGRVQSDLVKSLTAELPQLDLSDHKFWWPANKQWLTKTRYTLDQYGLNAECSIEFKTARRPLIVQLPDLQLRPMLVDFSATVFRVVIQICKELRLRHPEELSLMLLLSREDQRLQASRQQDQRRKPKRPDELGGTLLSPTSPGGTLHPGGGEPRWTVSPTQTMNTRTMGKTPTGTVTRPGTAGTPQSFATFRRQEMSSITQATSPSSAMSPSSYYSSTMPRPAMLSDVNSPMTNTLIRSRNGNSFEPYNPLQELISTPPLSSTEAAQRLTTSRPRGIVDKAFALSCWLDSSKSLLEQGVDKGSRVHLRFKFYSFFDLKPTKPNAVRMNQLYEHAKWSVLGEEVEATDEEAFSFAGLQYQIRTRQALETSSSEDLLSSSGSAPLGQTGPISPNSTTLGNTSRPVNADDVDAAITQLQVQLETGISTRGPVAATVAASTFQRPNSPAAASNVSRSPASAGQENLQEIPELKDFLKISRKSRFGLNKFSSSSPYWLVLRDLQLTVYRSKEDASCSTTPPVERMKLVNCEVQSTARSASDRKFVIRLFVPRADGMTEIVLKCKNLQQYAAWLAAFRLASRGKTMADASYENEVQCVLSSLTSPTRQSGKQLVISSPLTSSNGNARGSPNPPVELNIAEYLPASVAKRYKQKEIINRILEAHARVSAMSSSEAKMAYIRQWEATPYFDVSYFLVRIVQVGSLHVPPNAKQNASPDQLDVLGVAPNKLIRYDSAKSMSIVQVWSFERITSWTVDWEKRVVRVESEDGVLAFTCASCDCKVFHELLGGYIFMALRSSAQNKQLDEEMFQKLTGGRE